MLHNLDPKRYRQSPRPSLCAFILKELNAADGSGLVSRLGHASWQSSNWLNVHAPSCLLSIKELPCEPMKCLCLCVCVCGGGGGGEGDAYLTFELAARQVAPTSPGSLLYRRGRGPQFCSQNFLKSSEISLCRTTMLARA